MEIDVTPQRTGLRSAEGTTSGELMVSELGRSPAILLVCKCWRELWPSDAARIEVPLQLHLGEHDAIWLSDEGVVGRMAEAPIKAPRVDAALLREGGHLYKIHKHGRQHVESKIEFFAACDSWTVE
jgi:hypothetical protein